MIETRVLPERHDVGEIPRPDRNLVDRERDDVLRDEPPLGDGAHLSVLPQNQVVLGRDNEVRRRSRHAVVHEIVADRVQYQVREAEDDPSVDRDRNVGHEEDVARGVVYRRDAVLGGAAVEESGDVRDPFMTDDRITEYTRGRVVEPAVCPQPVSLWFVERRTPVRRVRRT